MSEPLPDLKQLAGHVLYGWRTGRTHDHKSYLNKEFYPENKKLGGHTSQSLRRGKTRFPAHWSDQKIVDAIAQVLESENSTVTVKGEQRIISGEVDHVKITVKYSMIDGKAVQVFGYPEKSPGYGTSKVKGNGRIQFHGDDQIGGDDDG